MDDRCILPPPAADPAAVEAAVERLFCQLPPPRPLGRGKRLLKPNLLAKHGPDKTTHPGGAAGGDPGGKAPGADDLLVADSPGGLTPALVKAFEGPAAWRRVPGGTGAPVHCLRALRRPPPGELRPREFTLLRPVLEADVLIDCPAQDPHDDRPFGRHKKLFGCIPGLQKAEWHMRLPEKKRFGEMLVDLLETVKPAFAVLDAVVAHEGDGPSGGTPRPVGFVAAAEDLCRWTWPCAPW